MIVAHFCIARFLGPMFWRDIYHRDMIRPGKRGSRFRQWPSSGEVKLSVLEWAPHLSHIDSHKNRKRWRRFWGLNPRMPWDAYALPVLEAFAMAKRLRSHEGNVVASATGIWEFPQCSHGLQAVESESNWGWLKIIATHYYHFGICECWRLTFLGPLVPHSWSRATSHGAMVEVGMHPVKSVNKGWEVGTNLYDW